MPLQERLPAAIRTQGALPAKHERSNGQSGMKLLIELLVKQLAIPLDYQRRQPSGWL